MNAPRYLLRKNIALRLVNDLPLGSVLEVGCGAGDFCKTLCEAGYSVTGVDFSPDAIQFCRDSYRELSAKGKLQFYQHDLDEIHGTYSAIFLFEVLEHIEDDVGALTKISTLLPPGGHLLLSVPAHQSWFGPSDYHVGHFRRYDAGQLLQLLSQCGFTTEVLWSYGIPLANLTEIIRNRIYANEKHPRKEAATKRSGVDRRIEAKFSFLLNDICMYPFYLLQWLFRKTDWGTGYIIRAVKT
ncbi:MAG: class I SAM-dependent methyltransferase [Deltaproteobacteria bacterium]|nr:class I SAM-dependent methyltransferase [Deltaproteobacteria bacterium]